MQKQFDLAYCGVVSVTDSDRMSRSEFNFFYETLKRTKKREQEERDKAIKEAKMKADAARAKARGRRRR